MDNQPNRCSRAGLMIRVDGFRTILPALLWNIILLNTVKNIHHKSASGKDKKNLTSLNALLSWVPVQYLKE